MLNKKFIHLIMLAAMLTGLFSLKPATSAHAATQTVNTLTDENDGSCLDGDCSLRDAIAVSAVRCKPLTLMAFLTRLSGIIAK